MGQLPFEKEKSQIIVKREEETSDKFGCNPQNRPVEELIEYGIINIDKPSGPTSHQVSAYVKEILKIKKAGHSGTLDPAVTGVLPVGLERGTRITNSLLKAGKEYICLMQLHDSINEEKIKQIIMSFQGAIEQLPPVRSAVKRRIRTRKIYYIEILEIQGRNVLFKAGTEAGTYIRKLCHDIGLKLESGAHMKELRRTKAGPFQEDTLVTLQDVKDALEIWKTDGNEEIIRKVIQPIEKGIAHLKKVWVRDTAVNTLCNGATLKMPGIAKLHDNISENDTVAVLTQKGELVLVGTAMCSSKQMRKKDRGTAVKSEQVFMQPGVYPKIEK